MASETYFGLNDRVRFSKRFLHMEPFAKEKSYLRGIVVEIDDSPRECCYYQVQWIAPPGLLRRIGIDPDDFIQSDHLALDK